MLSVEVAYSEKEQVFVKKCDLAIGARASDAIKAVLSQAQYAAFKESKAKIGIFSNLITPEHLLQHGDRVEIYRPLLIDPKAARALRAKGKKA